MCGFSCSCIVYEFRIHFNMKLLANHYLFVKTFIRKFHTQICVYTQLMNETQCLILRRFQNLGMKRMFCFVFGLGMHYENEANHCCQETWQVWQFTFIFLVNTADKSTQPRGTPWCLRSSLTSWLTKNHGSREEEQL